ncbi:MAG: helix-turn-helix domain-containing protein [Elusimicrobiota bacterium]
MDSVSNLGRRIRESRKRLQMTQSELARASGTNQQHISLIERAKVDPGFSTLNRILSALGLSWTVQPAFPGAGGWTRRLESLKRYNRWEQDRRDRLSPGEALGMAGALVGTFERLHGPPSPEPLEAKATAWKEWRRRLALCPA